MFVLQFPTPTPIPTPGAELSPQLQNQVVQLVGHAFDRALDKGLEGVLTLVGFALVALAIGWAVRQYTRRGEKSKAAAEFEERKNVGIAYNALVKLAERQHEDKLASDGRYEAQLKERDARNDQLQQMLVEMGRKQTDSIMALADAHNRNADKTTDLARDSKETNKLLEEQNKLLATWVETSGKMYSEGSEPVQDMRRQIDQITRLLDEIKNNYLTRKEAQAVINEAILKVFNQASKNIELVDAAMRTGLQEEVRRKTGPLPALSPEAPPTLPPQTEAATP